MAETPDNEAADTAALASKATVTADQAKATALAANPGATAVKVELGHENGLIPQYTTLAEDLASHGYVVIGLNPTYSASITVLSGQVIERSLAGTIADDATPEQAQRRGDELVEIWAADDRFAISEAVRMNGDGSSPFAGRLDVQRVGLLGHSFGGAAALEACHLDSRCSAAANLDGWPYGSVVRTGLNRPVLIQTLKGQTASLLHGPSEQFPEVQFTWH